MTEHDEQHHDLDGWPRPSADVLRELDRAAISWPEPERDETVARAA
jgi:hypothetical protein